MLVFAALICLSVFSVTGGSNDFDDRDVDMLSDLAGGEILDDLVTSNNEFDSRNVDLSSDLVSREVLQDLIHRGVKPKKNPFTLGRLQARLRSICFGWKILRTRLQTKSKKPPTKPKKPLTKPTVPPKTKPSNPVLRSILAFLRAKKQEKKPKTTTGQQPPKKCTFNKPPISLQNQKLRNRLIMRALTLACSFLPPMKLPRKTRLPSKTKTE